MTKVAKLLLGIDEALVDRAAGVAEKAMLKCGFSAVSISNMYGIVLYELRENGKWYNVTDSVISAIFSVTADLIKKIGHDATFQVHGNSSFLCLDGEEMRV